MKAFALRLVRLLDEALDAPHLRIDRQRLPGMDVAVAGRRMVGGHPEGDDLAGFRRRAGLGAQPGEFRPVLEHMVGGQHRHHRRGIPPRRPGRRRPDRRGAVAPLRLEQDRRLGADLLQLLGDPKTIVEIGDHHRRLEDRPVADQGDHRLEGRPVADQRNELLGQALAQLRPDAGPRAPAHDHRLDLAHLTLQSAKKSPIRRPTFCAKPAAQATLALDH